MSETLSPDAILPKGEFATLIGVSAGRVSQMISEGKIGTDALVGEGRTARIRVELARRQISSRRDIGQALGNGLMTRLDTSPPSAADAPLAMSTPKPDSIEEQLKRERLRGSQIANRKAAEEEEARKGRFVETSDTRQQMGRIATSMLQSVEGALPQMAAALAAKFGVPQRDALHILQTEFRSIRQAASERHRKQVVGLPDVLESVVAADEGTLV